MVVGAKHRGLLEGLEHTLFSRLGSNRLSGEASNQGGRVAWVQGHCFFPLLGRKPLFLFSFAHFFQLLRENRLANGLKPTNEQIKKFAMDTDKAVFGGPVCISTFSHRPTFPYLSAASGTWKSEKKKKRLAGERVWHFSGLGEGKYALLCVVSYLQ